MFLLVAEIQICPFLVGTGGRAQIGHVDIGSEFLTIIEKLRFGDALVYVLALSFIFSSI
ncbi:hypothetical protein JJE00_04615 [Candidatus Bathyarchaeota archaeon]|nr:hypothetical protein [Candidatus Bathyarchaeota archaeon]MCJ7713522.1 hypothetical protein [Candidatus Bathyarchaeota archaeon]